MAHPSPHQNPPWWLHRCVTIVVLALLTISVSANTQLASAATTRVLAVGNNIGHPDEVPLRYAEADARRFRRALVSFGGVKRSHAMLVLGASVVEVRQAFATINRRIANRPDTTGDTLIFFYSGHADARGLHLGNTTLSYDELKRLAKASKAQVKILFVDGCRSGGLTRVKGVRAAKPFAIKTDPKLHVEGLAFITSSTAGENSHESDALRASFFAHHLTNALKGSVADRNQDGRVTLSEAYSYTYHQTLRSSGKGLHLQHPTFAANLKGRGEVVLTEPARYSRYSGTLKLPLKGQYLVYRGSGKGAVVAELFVKKPGTKLFLRPGRYVVQRRSESVLLQYRAQVRRKQETDLALSIPQPIQYARLVRKGGGRKTSHSLSLRGGVRGEILNGQGPTSQWSLQYSLDMPWFTLGLRGRFSTHLMPSGIGETTTRQHEGALAVVLERYIDLPWFSLSFAIWGEAIYFQQRVTQNGLKADPRQTLAGAIGVLIGLERDVVGPLYLRLEGGPVTFIAPQATIVAGAETESKSLATPLSYWLAGGLGWRF